MEEPQRTMIKRKPRGVWQPLAVLIIMSALVNAQSGLSDIPFPNPSELGLSPTPIYASCSEFSAPRALLEDGIKFKDNVTWDITADISMVFFGAGKIYAPSPNPNHFIHDQMNGLMFMIANCMENVGKVSRRISVPSFHGVIHIKACRPTIHKADPFWQELFDNHNIGTLVPREKILTEDDIKVIRAYDNCSFAHSFSPAFVYTTALLLAGPNGSIVEFEHANTTKPGPAKNPVQWVVDWESRGTYRRFIAAKPSNREYSGMQRAMETFRRLVYHYIVPEENYVEAVNSTSCRIVLYDRSQEKGNSREWQDSKRMMLELQRQFPESYFVVLPRLPPRFADQALLFSGLDVLIGVHGGWAPNVMFLHPPSSNKLVFESGRWCDIESGHEWMSAVRDVTEFEVVKIPCAAGTVRDSQLMYDTAMPIITERLKRRCA